MPHYGFGGSLSNPSIEGTTTPSCQIKGGQGSNSESNVSLGPFICYMAGLVLAFSFPACADFSGRVVSVADGDTITVLVERQQVRVRLVEIDAPEKAQAFGTRSKQSLSDMCFGMDAQVQEKGKDRYGRSLGRVNCNGTDANAEQVRRGMAWVYDKYVTDHSLYELQDEARAANRGLWYDPDPVPPWDWRRR